MPMTREQVIKVAAENGYLAIRLLESGEWAGVQRFMFTYGLMVGVDEFGYRTRFCYESPHGALLALVDWSGEGDPPGDWIKEKGHMERDNPNRNQFKGIPITRS